MTDLRAILAFGLRADPWSGPALVLLACVAWLAGVML